MRKPLRAVILKTFRAIRFDAVWNYTGDQDGLVLPRIVYRGCLLNTETQLRLTHT
jgi:hypothetical protein